METQGCPDFNGAGFLDSRDHGGRLSVMVEPGADELLPLYTPSDPERGLEGSGGCWELRVCHSLLVRHGTACARLRPVRAGEVRYGVSSEFRSMSA